MWVFNGAAKPQEKAPTSEIEKPVQNGHSESSHQAVESFNEVAAIAAGEIAQISKEAVQSAKDEELNQNIAVDNLDTMDSKLNEESYFDRPSFNFRTYLKGQTSLAGSAPNNVDVT